MDASDSAQFTATVGSRTSQSPSPSHSAPPSASAAYSLRKRNRSAAEEHALPPPPPSSLSDTRLTTTMSNDDLDSVSARNLNDSDSDHAARDEYDQDSMRNFTTARLDNVGGVGGRVTKLMTEVNVESEGGKEGGSAVTPVGSAAAGSVVKEDASKIFTENSQTSGAYNMREESLKREEESGRLKFVCCRNDGIDEHMIWLIGLKNIFSRQLPNMPKVYIVRLVMDRSHKSVMVLREDRVVGGTTYRPYVSQRFGEIAFLAITADEQVQGYGTRLMNHLKQRARDDDGLTHLLTYADNNAVGYFIKQGFTKEITLDKEQWQGYIKHYDGGTLMECKIDPKLPYTDISTMVRRQRQAIDEKIRELSNCHIVYPGIDFQKNEAGIPERIIKPEDIPGLGQAGWTPDQYGHMQIGLRSTNFASNRKLFTAIMRWQLKVMQDHPDSWPFREPVDEHDAPDYYDIIKDPVDLKTISTRLESQQYYVTYEMFFSDVMRMFENACTYNSPETVYYKCATRLRDHMLSKTLSHYESMLAKRAQRQ
ncbi:hypothetical protein QQ045_028116 [Rhodiola kirilowii]